MVWEEHLKSLDYSNIHNKLWRIQNLYAIRNKKGEIVPMRLNKHQWRLVDVLIKNSVGEPIIILKPRQIGYSTFIKIWVLDDVLFYSGINAVTQSHKKESLEDLFQIIRLAYDRFPEALKLGVSGSEGKLSQDTKHRLRIGHMNSQIEVKLEVRSVSVNRIHFSEHAFTDPKRLAATEGSLTPDCLRIYESTPYGLNSFYDLYMSRRGKYSTIFVPWYEHDEYCLNGELYNKSIEEVELQKEYPKIKDGHLLFRRSKLTTMSDLAFRQEYPLNDVECFLESGACYFNQTKLMSHMNFLKNRDEIISRTQIDGIEIRVFEEFDEEAVLSGEALYFFGIDPSEGVGRDFSAGSLIKVTSDHKITQVASIHGQASPTNTARVLFSFLTKKYRTRDYIPMVVVERNNHGHAVLSMLRNNPDTLYYNLYFDKDTRAGFVTTRISKTQIMSDLRDMLDEEILEIKDPKTIEELLTIKSTDTGKIEAEEGRHDDQVIGLALAVKGYMHYLSKKKARHLAYKRGAVEEDNEDEDDVEKYG